MLPGLGDVEERLEEVGELAVGSKVRKGIAERVEASLEYRAVLRVKRIEPAAAGEEPVARVAGIESSGSDQHDKISRMQSMDNWLLRVQDNLWCPIMTTTEIRGEIKGCYMEIDFFLDRVYLKPHFD